MNTPPADALPKNFCQLKAISLRMFYCWLRKINLKDQGLDPLVKRQRKDDHDLAIVPLKVILEPEQLMATHALTGHRTAPSVRISLANKIMVEIFAEVQP
jgi:hypothetical protein